MTAPLIACIGHLSLDHVFEIDAFSQAPSDKTPARSYHPSSGGMGANAALAAARLGAQVKFFGAVGDDDTGRFVRARLAAEGIDLDGLQTVAGAHTSVSAVVVDACGQRQIFNHRGNALAQAVPLDVAALAGAQLVLVDPRWAASAAAALRWARAAGVPSIFDADIAPAADLRRLASLADWAVCSAPGLAILAQALPGADTLAALQADGAVHAMVTDGEHGVRWRDANGAEHHVPAFEVDAIDSAGAGDVFHAALGVALAEGQPERQALRFAAAAAALKCTRVGGIGGAPRRDEVERFLAARS